MLTEEQLKSCCVTIRLLAEGHVSSPEITYARERLRDLVELHVKIANKLDWTPEIQLFDYKREWEDLKYFLAQHKN